MSIYCNSQQLNERVLICYSYFHVDLCPSSICVCVSTYICVFVYESQRLVSSVIFCHSPLFKKKKSLVYLFIIVCVCTWVYALILHAKEHAWRWEKNLQESVLSCQADLGIELRSTGLAASIFTCWAIFLVFHNICFYFFVWNRVSCRTWSSHWLDWLSSELQESAFS